MLDKKKSIIPDNQGIFYRIIFIILKGISRFLWSSKVKGIEHIRINGPVIFCSNHESDFDPFWIASWLSRDQRAKLCSLAKKEHFESFLMSFLVKLVGSIPVDRSGDTTPAVQAAEKVLLSGRPMMIFPEGTRTKTGKLGKFHKGSVRLMLGTNVPIIPVRISGAFEILPYNKKFPKLFDLRRFRRYKILVNFGKPIYPPKNQKESSELVEELTNRLRQAIIELGK